MDKVKEKLKEEAIKKSGKYNYVKIENKQYGLLIETLKKLKNQEQVGNENGKFIPVFMTEETRNLLESTILNENIYKDTFYFDSVNIIKFHNMNDCILFYGLMLDNNIFYYLKNRICKTHVSDVIVDEMYSYRDPESYIDKDILNGLNQYVNNSLDDTVNAFNFPLKAIIIFGKEINIKSENVDNFDGDFSNLSMMANKFNIYKSDMPRIDGISLNESNNIINLSEFESADINDVSFEDIKKRKNLLIGKDYVGKIYFNNNEVIGYNSSSVDGEIKDIFVSEEYRHHGLGTQILNKCIEENESHNAVIQNDNISAIRLFQNAGFKVASKDSQNTYMSNSFGVDATPVTELDITTSINNSIESLNESSLNIKEKFILRMLNEASNKLELEITDNYINKIDNDSRKELFKSILNNRKIQLKI